MSPTDNEHLMDLVLDLRAHGVSQERVQELQQHLTMCQNRESCDGTIDENVWYSARNALEAALMLLNAIEQIARFRH